MWATLIQLVTSALQAGLPGVVVTAYADSPIPDVDTVRVLRGSSPARPLFAQQSGSETLALECWTRHDDAMTANSQLETLENNVIAVLRTLPRLDPILNISITGIDPDGELFRPNLGSRMTLTVTWRALRH